MCDRIGRDVCSCVCCGNILMVEKHTWGFGDPVLNRAMVDCMLDQTKAEERQNDDE